MPNDMPDALKQEAEDVKSQIRQWKSENNGKTWRDMPDELKQKMKSLREKYEKETGNEWPKHGGKHHHGGSQNETKSS